MFAIGDIVRINKPSDDDTSRWLWSLSRDIYDGHIGKVEEISYFGNICVSGCNSLLFRPEWLTLVSFNDEYDEDFDTDISGII